MDPLLREEMCVPFDLSHAPLWRALWAPRDGRQAVLDDLPPQYRGRVVTARVFRELEQLYAADCIAVRAGLPDLPVQYADYSAWQRDYLADGDLRERQRAYWTSQLCPPPPVLELPTELPRPVQRSGRGGVHRFRLSEQLVRSLRRLARQKRACSPSCSRRFWCG